MKSKLLAVVAGAGVVVGAGSALAQEAETVVEGPGYPLGEGTVIHPVVGAELGFDSNVFYEGLNEGPEEAGILRLVAEAWLASKEIAPEEVDPLLIEEGLEEEPAPPAARKLIYRAGGMLRYQEYLSGTDHVRAQRTLGADLKGNVTVSPEGTFAFDAMEHFVRDTRPTNFESFDSNNRIANDLALGLRYQPGGRQIAGVLRWENHIDYFEDSDQRFANRMINGLHLRGEYNFFPYSELFADVSVSFIGGFGGDGGEMMGKRSAMPIRGGVGVATAITEVFTVKAHLGWAYASYSGGASYNRPILGAEVGYRYMPTGRVVAEYNWDYRDSLNADYYVDHGLIGRIDQQFGPRIVASARGEVHWRGYRGVNPAVGIAGTDRDDLIFAVGAKGQYVLKDWLAIVADYKTEVDATDYTPMLPDRPDDPGYVRHEITAGVRAAF